MSQNCPVVSFYPQLPALQNKNTTNALKPSLARSNGRGLWGLKASSESAR